MLLKIFIGLLVLVIGVYGFISKYTFFDLNSETEVFILLHLFVLLFVIIWLQTNKIKKMKAKIYTESKVE